MLHFGAKMPFSFEKFINSCEGIISEDDVEIIKSLKSITLFTSLQPTLEKWSNFETSLRNELVKIRAARKHLDPSKYLRKDGLEDVSVSRLAMNAYKSPSALESEKTLDLERWNKLEELSLGHFFDIDFLIVYTIKLLILEKWDRITTADKPKLIEEALEV